MYIKGASRRSVAFWSNHLKDTKENDRADVIQKRGLEADDLRGMMNEMKIDAALTQCKNFMCIASFNPAPNEILTEQEWDKVYEIFEKHRGIPEGQQRIVVEHEKNGRIHRHVVWNRIDVENLRAFPDSLDLRACERAEHEIELTLGLQRTPHFLDRDPDLPPPQVGPKSYEMFRGMKTGIDPRDVTKQVTELYRESDNAEAFVAALYDNGYQLARGRRAFCILDPAGNDHSLARRIDGVTTKELREFMRDIDMSVYPTVEQAREEFRSRELEELEADRDTIWQELEWADELHEAAIAREESIKEFLEKSGPTRTPDKGWKSPTGLHLTPSPDTSPNSHFQDAAKEAGRPEQAPQIPDNLRGTNALIWQAYNVRMWETADGKIIPIKVARDPERFANALTEHGIELAAVTRPEAELSVREAHRAKLDGKWQPTFTDGQIVAVTANASVYQISTKNTGEKHRDLGKFLSKYEAKKLPGIEATKALMHDRAAEREAYGELASALNPAKGRTKEPYLGRSSKKPSDRVAARGFDNGVRVADKGALRILSSSLDVFGAALESLVAAPQTPERQYQGEVATEARELEGFQQMAEQDRIAQKARGDRER